jgi:hypothetical protein
MPIFVSVYPVTVSTENITLGYFIHNLRPRGLWVMANIKQFFSANMIKVERCRMLIIPANKTAARNLNCVNIVATRLLKSLRRYFLAGRIIPT